MKYRIIIEQDEDGVFTAIVPSLPGCISQGNTENEALSNINEAIEGYIESLAKHNETISPYFIEELLSPMIKKSQYEP